MNLCTVEDDEVIEKMRWVVDLSNGLRVYQDDNRHEVQPKSAWVRLKDYLTHNSSVSIVKYRFEFRTHKVHFPDNAPGYFFSKGLLANSSGGELHSYIGGFVKDGEVWTAKFIVPELTLEETEKRQMIDSPNLIYNPNISVEQYEYEWIDYFREEGE